MRSVVSTLKTVRREEEPPIAVGDAHAHGVAGVCSADISLQDGTCESRLISLSDNISDATYRIINFREQKRLYNGIEGLSSAQPIKVTCPFIVPIAPFLLASFFNP
ncbi:hypothetical protein M404DRAFT_995172 [Pisolithus tinctorius Marx 270]|uniref:Uncharacterized protein n=1 Tax=Pisolithus tinctorius Marx 270 TaxID=870435 RepID=A0A0C3PQA5_PISTI|nr:hypothetical protein M404DRAFT_995172 [Pisolithus tinctorius Marx 270]